MPADEGGGLRNGQGLAPVEPACEPDEDKAGGIGRAFRLDVALLIHSQLFAQKQVFRSQGGAGTQAETQETQAVVEEGQQGAHALEQGAEQVRASCHGHGVHLRQALFSLPIVAPPEGWCPVLCRVYAVWYEVR